MMEYSNHAKLTERDIGQAFVKFTNVCSESGSLNCELNVCETHKDLIPYRGR